MKNIKKIEKMIKAINMRCPLCGRQSVYERKNIKFNVNGAGDIYYCNKCDETYLLQVLE